ncbi:MAG: TadE/TadG family type IV pilus assembly protein [Oceanicaulis sp.]
MEFALIAPVMIAMYLGSAELTQALTMDRKVTGAANAVADLVAQDDFVTDAEMDDIKAAAAAILAPARSDTLALRITSVRMDADGDVFVDWSESDTLPALTDDTLPALPQGLLSPMRSIVMVEATYPFQSAFQRTIKSEITLADTAYLRPRRSPWVRRES